MQLLEFIRTKLSFSQRLEAWLVGLGLGCICIGIVAGMAFFSQYQLRYYPNIYINKIPIGGLNQDEAARILTEQTPTLPSSTITLSADGITLASSSAELGLQYDFDQTLAQAMVYAKEGPFYRRVIQLLKLQYQPLELQAPLTFDETKVTAMLAQLQPLVDIPDQEPQASLKTSGVANSLSIFAGEPGRAIDVVSTASNLQYQASLSNIDLEVTVASIGAELTESQLSDAQVRAEKLVGKSLVFHHPDKTLRLNDQNLIELLAFPEGVRENEVNKVITNWQTQVTREPQDAVFEYDPTTLKVKTFIPHLNGLELDEETTQHQLVEFITTTAASDTELPEFTQVELQLAVKKPDTTLAKTNDLGIIERIGWGDSEYDHSIPSRIHNVALTSRKINNIIIKPGEEFSFNKALGDVSAATGFQPAYIIKNGQTVLGDGGGVCQVSTTLFRAVLNAGLNVTKRRPHSYRVSYYELNAKPGIDATVYSGDVDLRFVNDTGKHILVRSEADSKNLYMAIELYGTSDGRTAEIIDHKTWGYQPAPPAIYIPDPSLPTGQLKQIDWAASGIKASFIYKVTDKDGQVMREQTFTSNYIPWSAKYLRGEQI
jgi:vancomycin resistance protein YoaR